MSKFKITEQNLQTSVLAAFKDMLAKQNYGEFEKQLKALNRAKINPEKKKKFLLQLTQEISTIPAADAVKFPQKSYLDFVLFIANARDSASTGEEIAALLLNNQNSFINFDLNNSGIREKIFSLLGILKSKNVDNSVISRLLLTLFSAAITNESLETRQNEDVSTESIIRKILNSSVLNSKAKKQFILFLLETKLVNDDLLDPLFTLSSKMDPGIFHENKNQALRTNPVYITTLLKFRLEKYLRNLEISQPASGIIILKHLSQAPISAENKLKILKSLNKDIVLKLMFADRGANAKESVVSLYLDIITQIINENPRLLSAEDIKSLLFYSNNNIPRSFFNMKYAHEQKAYLDLQRAIAIHYPSENVDEGFSSLLKFFLFSGHPKTDLSFISTLVESNQAENFLAQMDLLIAMTMQESSSNPDNIKPILNNMIARIGKIIQNKPEFFAKVDKWLQIVVNKFDWIDMDITVANTVLMMVNSISNYKAKSPEIADVVRSISTLIIQANDKGLLTDRVKEKFKDTLLKTLPHQKHAHFLIFVLKNQPVLLPDFIKAASAIWGSGNNISLLEQLMTPEANKKINTIERLELIWQFYRVGLLFPKDVKTLAANRKKADTEYIFKKILQLPLSDQHAVISNILADNTPLHDFFLNGKNGKNWKQKFIELLSKLPANPGLPQEIILQNASATTTVSEQASEANKFYAHKFSDWAEDMAIFSDPNQSSDAVEKVIHACILHARKNQPEQENNCRKTLGVFEAFLLTELEKNPQREEQLTKVIQTFLEKLLSSNQLDKQEKTQWLGFLIAYKMLEPGDSDILARHAESFFNAQIAHHLMRTPKYGPQSVILKALTNIPDHQHKRLETSGYKSEHLPKPKEGLDPSVEPELKGVSGKFIVDTSISSRPRFSH